MDYFDATKVEPSQGGTAHPPGMYDFTISQTYAKTTKDGNGGMLVVEFTSPVGRIENRYNLWNQSAQAVEIAQKQLAALCYAVHIYKITFPKDAQGNPIMDQAGRELCGGRGKMEVAPQTDREGKPNGYMEIKKVYDANGNEPGKTGAAPQPQPQQQPAAQPNASQPQVQTGWGNPAPQNAPNPSQPPSQPQGQANPAWGSPQAQPAQNPSGAPPWMNK